MGKTKTILSKRQKQFLDLAPETPIIDNFYLSGGTALCEYYIPYRYSEDLDFFSENEFDISSVVVYIKTLKRKLKHKKIDINSSFNRNIIQLIFGDEILKLEFTYYPFHQIQTPQVKNGIKIDSLIDIATNKLFTIYQNPRSRDYMDLYKILLKEDMSMENLVVKAKTKFDWHIDPLKLGSQFIKAKELKDYPRLIKKTDHTKWQEYFVSEARKLRTSILSD